MEHDKKEIDTSLNRAEKDYLLAIARNAILGELDMPQAHVARQSNPILRSHRGAFVTLKIAGRLRGCIGYIEGSSPLQKTIADMAKAAAFQDPRFPALTAKEVPSVTIEISILSPLFPITQPEEIEVGKHGLVIEQGYRRGLLLPQVASEYKWDRDVFLEHTCEKAGLAKDAWKDADTRIFVFSAQVFAEEEAGGR
ncbi:MAG: AmmeMemoRadiSam system protein A [Candidatus Latescibacterota bacterium]